MVQHVLIKKINNIMKTLAGFTDQVS
jgi:hypothetical protein